MRAQSKGKDAVRWGGSDGGVVGFFFKFILKDLMLFVTLGAATVHLVLPLKAVCWWCARVRVCVRAQGQVEVNDQLVLFCLIGWRLYAPQLGSNTHTATCCV